MEEEDEATAKAVNDDDSEEAVLDPGTPIPSEEEDGGPCLGDAKKTTKVATVEVGHHLFRDLFFQEVKLQNAKKRCAQVVFAKEEVAEPVKVETETPAEEGDGSTKARHELELQMSHCHQ